MPNARCRRGWRPALRFTHRDHELSRFELLFDVMAAFAFAQTDVLVLRDQTPEGALRGLLVLAVLWGCWLTYVWAANTADADVCLPDRLSSDQLRGVLVSKPELLQAIR
jgi:low temperature requirement protein LtrA